MIVGNRTSEVFFSNTWSGDEARNERVMDWGSVDRLYTSSTAFLGGLGTNMVQVRYRQFSDKGHPPDGGDYARLNDPDSPFPGGTEVPLSGFVAS